MLTAARAHRIGRALPSWCAGHGLDAFVFAGLAVRRWNIPLQLDSRHDQPRCGTATNVPHPRRPGKPRQDSGRCRIG